MMGENTAISWTDHTWNPWVGCRKVSAGCKNCYMFRDQAKYGNDPLDIHRTTDKTFLQPYHYAQPGRVFTCSWSDFFIEQADPWRADAWDIIRSTPHAYQILTKRIDRVWRCLPNDWGEGYSNVWLGTSVENQEAANLRVPVLATLPARVRFLSVEPLLGPVVIPSIYDMSWVICGGESGPGFRPMDLDWARAVRDQCQVHGVPFFFKQSSGNKPGTGDTLDGVQHHAFPDAPVTASSDPVQLSLL